MNQRRTGGKCNIDWTSLTRAALYTTCNAPKSSILQHGKGWGLLKRAAHDRARQLSQISVLFVAVKINGEVSNSDPQCRALPGGPLNGVYCLAGPYLLVSRILPEPTLPPQPTMTRSQPSTPRKKGKLLSPNALRCATLKAMPSALLASTSPSAPKPKDVKTAVSQAVLPSANNHNAQLSASEIP